jgi:hypothetical protein
MRSEIDSGYQFIDAAAQPSTQRRFALAATRNDGSSRQPSAIRPDNVPAVVLTESLKPIWILGVLCKLDAENHTLNQVFEAKEKENANSGYSERRESCRD